MVAGLLEHKWEDNISTDLKVMDGEGVGWSLLIENWQKLVHMVLKPQCSIKVTNFFSSSIAIRFLTSILLIRIN